MCECHVSHNPHKMKFLWTSYSFKAIVIALFYILGIEEKDKNLKNEPQTEDQEKLYTRET